MMKKEKGSSLYLTLLIMSVMLAVVLGLTNVIVGGAKLVGGLSNSVKAFTAADTGIEMALYQIYKSGSCSSLSSYLPGESSSTGYGYSYTISGTCLSSDMVIDSTGMYSTSSRKIEITFGGSTSQVAGSCGTAAKTYVSSASSFGSDTLCATGNPSPESVSFPDQGSSVNWTCSSLGGGANANCTAYRGAAPANGVCGAKNGKYADATPTGADACSSGTVTGMTGSYSWTCSGSNGGSPSGTCATVAATYAVQSFTTPGTSNWAVPTGVTSVQYLVVAGGGSGGGGGHGGGGGAGGLLTGTTSVSSGSNINVVVGAGGAAKANGSDSSFGSTITAKGGGYGGWYPTTTGGSGGSGGGGFGAGGTSSGGSGTAGQGYGGGTGYIGTTLDGAGGGGGAGGAGSSGAAEVRNVSGGPGVASSITGTSVTYSAGGRGNCSSPVAASIGGGGDGGDGATNGVAGGSGIVIIKYINNYY